MLINIFENS